jgi:hypothetical protein
MNLITFYIAAGILAFIIIVSVTIAQKKDK